MTITNDDVAEHDFVPGKNFPTNCDVCGHGHYKETDSEKLDRVLTELAAIRGDIQESKTFIERIMGEVKPVLDTLTNNNMFKMMFGGKK